MPAQENVVYETYIAGSDMSDDQYKFVSLSADEQVDLCGDGAYAIGVLADTASAAGRAVSVAVSGKVSVKCGGAITTGGAVACDANGLAVAATTGDVILGTATQTGANGRVIAVKLHARGDAA